MGDKIEKKDEHSDTVYNQLDFKTDILDSDNLPLIFGQIVGQREKIKI